MAVKMKECALGPTYVNVTMDGLELCARKVCEILVIFHKSSDIIIL